MHYKQLFLFALLLTFTGISTLHAQVSINASGGNATSSAGSVSYSIGQMLYQSYESPEGTIAQGVQIPYEISVFTFIQNEKKINLSVTAFPNPATDYLTLRVDEPGYANLSFRFYDSNGKLLQNNTITSSLTTIYIGNLTHSTYFLTVAQGNIALKTFKIVKK